MVAQGNTKATTCGFMKTKQALHHRTQYKSVLLVVILFGMALISCKTTEIKDGKGQAVVMSDSANSLALKPVVTDSLPKGGFTTDFDSFLVEFGSSIEIQHHSVKVNLKHSSMDMDAEPEPRMIDKIVPIHEVVFPVFPLDSTRQVRNLLHEVSKVSEDSVIVTLHKPDTDYQVNYHFHRDQQWVLDWVEDQSL